VHLAFVKFWYIWRSWCSGRPWSGRIDRANTHLSFQTRVQRIDVRLIQAAVVEVRVRTSQIWALSCLISCSGSSLFCPCVHCELRSPGHTIYAPGRFWVRSRRQCVFTDSGSRRFACLLQLQLGTIQSAEEYNSKPKQESDARACAAVQYFAPPSARCLSTWGSRCQEDTVRCMGFTVSCEVLGTTLSAIQGGYIVLAVSTTQTMAICF